MTQPSDQTEIILYKTSDGNIKIDTVFQNETIWLTQAQMAELFGVKRPAVTKHLKNIFESGELDEKVVVSILEHTTSHGARQRKTVTMEQWSDKLNAFLEFNEQELLTHAGKVKAEVAKKLTEERYEQFDKKRKIEEAKKADKEDIKELEEYLKRYKQ